MGSLITVKQSRYLIWAAFLIVISFSCNIIKNAEIQHAEKKLDKIHWKFPDVMAQKLAQYYPPVNSITTIDTTKDSSAYFKKLSDSLKQLKSKVYYSIDSVKIKSNCAAIDSAAFEAGMKFGHQLGLYDGRIVCPPSTTSHDTTTSSRVLALIDALTKSNANQHDSVTTLTAQLGITKKESSTRFWVMLAEGSSILLFFVGLITGKVKFNFTSTPVA